MLFKEHARYAGIAQLVERNLAKVEVASSNLVSRSKQKEAQASFFISPLGTFGRIAQSTLHWRMP